jgi:galactose mutarotase-like enzyme
MPEVYSIENQFLKAKFKKKGAELCSVINQQGFEFIWQAEAVWPRHAPNLFPIVGSLKDHEYSYKGKTIPLSHHGFARDLNFDVLHQSEHSICFVLQENEFTLKQYPFQFTLLLTYTLDGTTLNQKFRVINNHYESIPVSFGGHPAFSAKPVDEYTVVFSQPETSRAYALEGPLISDKTVDVIQGDSIPITRNTFDHDALVFMDLKSDFVTLKHNMSNHFVKVSLNEFPYLGIWAKPGADYVCIEPWQGIADFTNHDKKIENKKGVVWLEVDQELARSFSMEFGS